MVRRAVLAAAAGTALFGPLVGPLAGWHSARAPEYQRNVALVAAYKNSGFDLSTRMYLLILVSQLPITAAVRQGSEAKV